MKVVVKRVGEGCKVVDIEGSLRSMQETVGGYIETTTPIDADDFIVICDEEGRIKGKQFNCEINGISYVGTIIICGLNADGDDFGDLADEYISQLVGA